MLGRTRGKMRARTLGKMRLRASSKTETRRQILIYSVLLVPIGMAPWFIGLGGLAYLVTSTLLGGYFLWLAGDVYRIREEGADADARAKRLFLFSIFYLFALFALLIVDRTPGVAG